MPPHNGLAFALALATETAKQSIASPTDSNIMVNISNVYNLEILHFFQDDVKVQNFAT